MNQVFRSSVILGGSCYHQLHSTNEETEVRNLPKVTVPQSVMELAFESRPSDIEACALPLTFPGRLCPWYGILLDPNKPPSFRQHDRKVELLKQCCGIPRAVAKPGWQMPEGAMTMSKMVDSQWWIGLHSFLKSTTWKNVLPTHRGTGSLLLFVGFPFCLSLSRADGARETRHG